MAEALKTALSRIFLAWLVASAESLLMTFSAYKPLVLDLDLIIELRLISSSMVPGLLTGIRIRSMESDSSVAVEDDSCNEMFFPPF